MMMSMDDVLGESYEPRRQYLRESALLLIGAMGRHGFPSDVEGVDSLLAETAESGPGEPNRFVSKPAGELPRDSGRSFVWVSPAGEKALRLRLEEDGLAPVEAVLDSGGRLSEHVDGRSDLAENQSAEELFYRLGLLLLADARKHGKFFVDRTELTQVLNRLGDEFDGARLLLRTGEEPDWTDGARCVGEVVPSTEDRIELECRCGRHVISAELGIDGVLENEMFGGSF